MIRLAGVSKRYPGAGAGWAVHDVTLAIERGELIAVLGESGSGKTTLVRMINRLIDPDAGSVHVGGRDVREVDPVVLRRSIGYVIQQIGLFPHWTIAQNVATVPRLLAWDEARIAKRVDELLHLVGMDPGVYRDRFPRELSGGQRQRVGVARALAADPPVMLMDEPFGAIDPITRARLQDEFLNILRTLERTVVFVTHDIDEALKMGDRIAIMRDGELVQYDTPEAILAHPADAFVESFTGSDRALRRLALVRAEEAMTAPATLAHAEAVDASASLRDALAAMFAAGVDAIAVMRGGTVAGVLTLAAIRGHALSDRGIDSRDAPP